MWLITRYGAFSAVCARQGDGKLSNPPDPNRIMVRARLRSHLEALLRRFSDRLSECEIRESTKSDYRFRIFVSKRIWATVAFDLVQETDYDNFKSEVARFNGGRHDSPYLTALHRIWSVLYGLQEREHGPGIYSARKNEDGQQFLFDGLDADPVEYAETATGLYYEVSTAQPPLALDEAVVMVFEQDTGKVLGVIRYPSVFEDEADAYAKAVELKALPLVAHPEFQSGAWAGFAAEHANATLFDIVDFSEPEGAGEGDERYRPPFDDMQVIRLAEMIKD